MQGGVVTNTQLTECKKTIKRNYLKSQMYFFHAVSEGQLSDIQMIYWCMTSALGRTKCEHACVYICVFEGVFLCVSGGSTQIMKLVSCFKDG